MAQHTEATDQLFGAAQEGNEDSVEQLLGRPQGEIDINATNPHGRTPISIAAERGHDTVVRLLLGQDEIKPDLKDRQGRTPLSYAAEQGHATVVKSLLERDDVDPNSRDKNDLTPLLYAAGVRPGLLVVNAARGPPDLLVVEDDDRFFWNEFEEILASELDDAGYE